MQQSAKHRHDDDDELASDRRVSFALPGFILAGIALICAILTLFVLLGVTPIAPTHTVVIASGVVNGLCVFALIYLIAREINRLLRARRKGRAAARLHVRIVSLFSIVAITPAVLVAIFASLTLNVGLDRWFAIRTQAIVESSGNIAQAYMLENAGYLQGQTLSMATDLDRNRALFYLDRTGFIDLLTRQAKGRGLLGAFLVQENGSAIVQADIETDRPLPAIPSDALEKAAAGQPTLIPPGITNLVGAIIKLEGISGTYLYTVRAVDPKVMNAMRLMEENRAEYKAMESGRAPLQIAFAILYLGFALIVLLAAIWTAIAVADRIVRPIRLLISAADAVAMGNMHVVVPVRIVDGDVGRLSQTFNKMVSELRSQQAEIIEAKDDIDDRRRFIEAVLSGVTAAVIGIDENRMITIVNRSAQDLLALPADELTGHCLTEIAPEIEALIDEAIHSSKANYRTQVNIVRRGIERTLSVQVTLEDARNSTNSFVITLDDITDLLIAQRSTAWSDVARRIAHEIKNPLTPIQLSAERIRRRFGKQIDNDADRAVFEQCTDTIVRQVGDIGRMVDEFSAFARMPKPTKEITDLRAILKDSVFLREISAHHIRFSSDLGDMPLMGLFDARMLGQAFGNLIKNASESIEAVNAKGEHREGKITVSARYDSAANRFVADVIDNGVGLPVENRHRILEPYMTMREKGTGLGLAIVKKIIEEHGGQLELHDAPTDFDNGHGAMFRILLPHVEVSSAEIDKEIANGL